MPIKKDDKGNRWVEMDFIAPGTPEQVWQAMATGGGTTAWFTQTTIEERVGGRLEFDFGPNGRSAGEVTAWEPPSRFGYVERNWKEGAPPVATEITITARAGDRCVVRMVHSLFATSDDWDDQLEGFETGWPAFFEVLRLYLAHFPGRPAASFLVVRSIEDRHLAVWTRLTEQLALAGANAGESRTTPAHPEVLSGVIERIQQGSRERYILIRLDAPAPGIALVGTYEAGSKVNVSVAMYFYGDHAGSIAASSEETWRRWLGEGFMAPAGA